MSRLARAWRVLPGALAASFAGAFGALGVVGGGGEAVALGLAGWFGMAAIALAAEARGRELNLAGWLVAPSLPPVLLFTRCLWRDAATWSRHHALPGTAWLPIVDVGALVHDLGLLAVFAGLAALVVPAGLRQVRGGPLGVGLMVAAGLYGTAATALITRPRLPLGTLWEELPAAVLVGSGPLLLATAMVLSLGLAQRAARPSPWGAVGRAPT